MGHDSFSRRLVAIATGRWAATAGSAAPAPPGRPSRSGGPARHRGAAVLTALATAACVVCPAAARADGGPARERLLQRQFTSAAGEFGVPVGVLLALAYQESRWESHQGRPSTTGNHGVLGLTDVDVAAVNAVNAVNADHPARRGAAGAAKPRVTDSPALHTLRAAAALIHRPAEEVKRDTLQNLRGGAAMLAGYRNALPGPVRDGAGGWYEAVTRFGRGAGEDEPGRRFADRVFETLRVGAERTTSEGARVRLAAEPDLVPPAARPHRPAEQPSARPSRRADGPVAECPDELGCDFVPAAYALADAADPTSWGNYNPADRPADGLRIRTLVLHDTEGGFDGAIEYFQDPRAQASAHYLVRASDGHVTQLVATHDIAWHSGNKTVNMHSIGIEHEGFALPTDRPTWYSEQLYRSSAELVRHLAARFAVPLDREHVIGHDEVPAPTQAAVSDMHWDPGPYWDWEHYFELLGAPPGPADGPPRPGDTVAVVAPLVATGPLPPQARELQARNAVLLRTGPAADAPLVNDGSTRPDDWSDTAVTGARYVVAGREGDWTAIWYDGQKCWFPDPAGLSTRRVGAAGRTLLTPRPGPASVPVYGRAYPEASAYADHPAVDPPPVVALRATLPAGQVYVAADGSPRPADFFQQRTIRTDTPDSRILVVGRDTYYAIRFDHRLAFVRSSDVRVVPPTAESG
ncbi:peptidoglycan recognition family protein [Kitasatospora sp. NPDC005748]|uniref:N-acetylmuramoyl-L-alanine amidase n=1 Tax=Kitasatospora sp. NPDC005748 TaxID=3157063 RepID=UPI0033F7BC80